MFMLVFIVSIISFFFALFLFQVAILMDEYYNYTPILDYTLSKIIIVILSLAIGFSCFSLITKGIKEENTEWNNGYCISCGEELIFTNASSSGRYGQFITYFYKCNKCNKVYRFHCNFNE